MWNVFIKTIMFQKHKELENEPKPTQLQFLMSSLNIELVHIILTAVSSKTVGIAKSEDFRNYHDYDFSSKNTITLDCIEIENREDWDFSDVEKKEDLFGISKKIEESLLPKFNTLIGRKT